MTDLEMTRLCAEAMGLHEHASLLGTGDTWADSYDPLHDDAQAMALLKYFKLQIARFGPFGETIKVIPNVRERIGTMDEYAGPDLNRAIVECVAKMEAK